MRTFNVFIFIFWMSNVCMWGAVVNDICFPVEVKTYSRSSIYFRYSILVARHSKFGAFSFALFPFGLLLWNTF